MFLANSVDEIEVLSPQDVLLDSFAYGTGTGIPVPNGFSIERKDATAPPWASNFAVSTTIFGAGDRGTPGALNSQDHTPPWGSMSNAGSLAPGGNVMLTLFAAGTAAKPYQLALSHAAAPAIVFPTHGRSIDLAFGWLLDFSLVPNNGVTSGFAGVMSGLGYGIGTGPSRRIPRSAGSPSTLPES